MKKQVLEVLPNLVLAIDQEGVEKATQEALGRGYSPQVILNALAEGMEAVGQKFECGEYFLPELVYCAEIMKSALKLLRPHMPKMTATTGKKVILATPKGDVHDIGKNILGGLLEGSGFEVHDLGIDVPSEEIIKKIQEIKADVVGLSALVSSGVSSMAETVILLKEKNIRAKVIIGGAACTPQTARTTGADAYGKDAWEGIEIIRQWDKGGK